MAEIKIERSSSYPSLSLEEALSRLVQLKDSMGLNGDYRRETVANGIGYSTLTGTSGRAVAALVHYGLLTRERDIYRISPLGRHYLLPISGDSSTEVLREAALKPDLFKQLYEEYVGQVLPKLLVNVLVTKYGIQLKVAPTVVRLFESTMAFAGLLEPSGRLAQTIASAVDEDNPREDANGGDSSIPQVTVSTVATPKLDITSDKPFNEQGVNHSGDGWALTVVIKSGHRLPANLRKAIRDLLESADGVADQFYDLEQKEP